MRFSDATREIGPALIGAGGAIALNYAMQYLPLPASMQSGITAQAVQFGGALALGVAAGAVAGKRIGMAVAMGGMVVVSYSMIANLMSGALGTGAAGTGGGTYGGTNTVGRFVPPGTPRNFRMGRMGYQGPARIVGPAFRPMPVRQGVGRFVPMGRP